VLRELVKLVRPNRKLLLVVRSRLQGLQEPQELPILRTPVAHRPSPLQLVPVRELEVSYHPNPALTVQLVPVQDAASYHPNPELPVLLVPVQGLAVPYHPNPVLPALGSVRAEAFHLFYCALEWEHPSDCRRWKMRPAEYLPEPDPFSRQFD
jgi:hypothetical protein